MPKAGKALTLTLALAVLAVACTASAGAKPSARAAATEDSLTVEVPLPVVNFAIIFVAQSAGLFAKHGLNVKVMEATGASTLPQLVSGQADLAIFSTTQGLQLSSQGAPVSNIFNYSRDPGSFLIGGPGVTSIEQLKALGSKCHIVTATPGAQSSGYANQYVKMAALGLQQCSIDNTPSTAVTLAQLGSGQDQAAVSTYTTYALAKKAFGATILINANLPGYRKKYKLPDFNSGTIFGMKANLQAKRPAVVKFLRAINDATKLLVPKNLNMLTNYLQTYGSFSANSFETNRTSLQFTILSIGPGANLADKAQIKARPNAATSQPGWLSKSVWQTSLGQWAKWGVPNLDTTASYASYENAVDMSYLLEALKTKN